MDQDLAEFFTRHSPLTEEMVAWDTLHFQVRSYVCAELPPLRFITSVRSIMLHIGQVLVVRDPSSQHILPGGRLENGETLDETLRREMLEETGWTMAESHYLGVKHFHHLTPKPTDYPYPYPDFIQAIYGALANEFHAEAREHNGYELEAVFYPAETVQAMPLSASERVFLKAAHERLSV